jgi:hypothetical protein
MARSKIDGDQIQDETITGANVLDESITIDDLQSYSLTTLRDSQIVSPALDEIIIYNSTNSKWENKPIPRYGKDFNSQIKEVDESTTGGTFAVYDTLNFNVTSQEAANKYRFNADFLYGHNSASNDIRVRIMVDGVTIKEMRTEVKDPGTDQRVPGSLLSYLENMTVGPHTLTLEYRPATASRQSRMYQSTLEVWRSE